MKKSFVKLTTISAVIVFTTMLFGCSQKNPLNQPNKKANATFLVNASKSAEKQLNIRASGAMYGQCMDGKAKQATCDALYKKIVDYAKTQPNYKNITVVNLKDKKAWQILKEDYSIVRFQSID